MNRLASEIAKKVIRPILLEGNRPAMAVYAGENCKFHFPIDMVMGKDANNEGAFQLMINNMRKVVETAIAMVDEGNKLTDAKEVALNFARTQVDGLVRTVEAEDGSALGIGLYGDGEAKFFIPLENLSFDEGRSCQAEARVEELKNMITLIIVRAILDFYHWHVSNEVQEYMEANQ